MQNSIMPIGSILRSAREAKGLTQAVLAKKIGVSNKTVVALEKNQRSPSFEVFCRLVLVLDISADLIISPDRVPHTAELEQLIRELLACGEREQRIMITTLRSLLWALQQDEPEKQV